MPLEELDEILKGHLRKRRRSFQWYRFCGELTAPEGLAPRICFGCATAQYGVVY